MVIRSVMVVMAVSVAVNIASQGVQPAIIFTHTVKCSGVVVTVSIPTLCLLSYCADSSKRNTDILFHHFHQRKSRCDPDTGLEYRS